MHPNNQQRYKITYPRGVPEVQMHVRQLANYQKMIDALKCHWK